MTTNKDVIINVYTESSKPRFHKNHDRVKKFNRDSSQGYNRHAQLLAYAQELRRCNSGQIRRSYKNSRPKQKKWRLSFSMQKIRSLFPRFRGNKKGWKYEQIITEDCDDNRMKNRKTNKCSNFSKRLKCFLKDIAKTWKCNGTC